MAVPAALLLPHLVLPRWMWEYGNRRFIGCASALMPAPVNDRAGINAHNILARLGWLEDLLHVRVHMLG